jgi:hypothetical protein
MNSQGVFFFIHSQGVFIANVVAVIFKNIFYFKKYIFKYIFDINILK